MKGYLAVVLSCGLIGGCASLSGIPERAASVETELAALAGYFSPDVMTTYDGLSGDSEKKAYRDKVIAARIRAIDLNFNQFAQNISAENKKLNIGTDATVLLLGAAGAVSTVTSTQAILAATSATVTGVKTSIDKNAYFDATLAALLSQMQANRKKVLVNLYAGMQMADNAYPLMRALVDLEDYFQAGTIIGAVNEISKEAGVQKSAADSKINDIMQGSYLRDKAGDTLRQFWKPDGKTADATNEASLKAWMAKNGISDTSLTLFLRAAHFADARALAVKELDLP